MPFDYLDNDDKQAAHDLARRIATGAWVLFSGAGVSIPSGLPDGKQLLRRIEEELGLPVKTFADSELPAACTQLEFTDGKERSALIDLLRRELDTSTKEPSEIHQLLLDLSPPEILTTNPEDLWEKALRRHKASFVVIIRGSHWTAVSSELPLVKLHGDLNEPDTLVFTTDDFSRYPKDELIAVTLQASLTRRSFLFVGYSANDSDIIRELQWVTDRIGGPPRHFLITDVVDKPRRRHLASQGVRVIALGTYSNFRQFLLDLAEEVMPLRATSVSAPGVGFKPTLPVLLSGTVVADFFKPSYEPIRDAVAAWRLREAEDSLQRLLRDVDELAAKQPDIVPFLADFRQRMLLALSNIRFWRVRRAEALDAWAKAQAIGPFSSHGRRQQAAAVAANLNETEVLDELLRDGLGDSGLETKYRAVLAALRGRAADAATLIPADTDDADLILLRIEVTIENLSEAQVAKVLEELESAWRPADTSPPEMLRVSYLTFVILQRIVREGWAVLGLDRKGLLTTIRSRFLETIARFETLRTAFPEGLTRALTAAISFHGYLGEEEHINKCVKTLRTLVPS